MNHALRVLVSVTAAAVTLSAVGVASGGWAVDGPAVAAGASLPSGWPVAPLVRAVAAEGTENVSVAVGDGALTVDWRRVKGAARYRVSWREPVFRGGEPTGAWSAEWLGRKTFGATQRSFQVVGLVNGRKYQVRLESRGKARRSRWVVFSTTAARPSASVPTSTVSASVPAPSTPTAPAPPIAGCASGGAACVVGSTGPGGGTVFYAPSATFTVTGAACGSDCRYLEAAPADWSAGSSSDPLLALSATNGGCSVPMDASAYATALLIGSGLANTAAIMAVCPNASGSSWSPAARAASLYAPTINGGTVSGWFLPSRDELWQLAQSGVGGLQTSVSDPNGWESYYWSSSQTSPFYSALIGWDGTNWFKWDENSGHSLQVRPVRAFS